MKIPAVIAAVFLLGLGGACAQSPLDNWQLIHPQPQADQIHKVRAAGNGFVSVGDVGTMMFSADGISWDARQTGTTFALRDCDFGNDRYVAVGDYGTVLYSTNGMDWQSVFAGTFYSLQGVAFGNGVFVAVGDGNTILTSSDGINWSSRASGPWNLESILFTGERFVVGGGDGSGSEGSTSVILSSPDGLTWDIDLFEAGPRIRGIAQGGQTLVAIVHPSYYSTGPGWKSTDGRNWSRAEGMPYNLSGTIAFANGNWVVGTGTFSLEYWSTANLYASPDLENWTVVATNLPAVTTLAANGERFVAGSVDGSIRTSDDGITWTNHFGDKDLVRHPSNFAFVNNEFWQIGYHQFARSPDGLTWTNRTQTTNELRFHDVAYGHGLYVAGSEYRTVWISTNGVHWSNPAPETSIRPYVADTYLTFGGGTFVAVGGPDMDILTSTNGRDWSVQQLGLHSPSHPRFRDVAWHDGRFVAVSEYGIATSTDGYDWHLDETRRSIYSVVGGNGRFVAVGSELIASSTDGTNWTTFSTNPNSFFTGVAFGNGVFVAAGTQQDANYAVVPFSPLWTSMDGIHWSQRHIRTGTGLGIVAFGGDRFLLQGPSAIYRSEPIMAVGMNMPAGELQIQGPANRMYRIEYRDLSPSLGTWQKLMDVNSGQGKVSQSLGNQAAPRMYRAVLPE